LGILEDRGVEFDVVQYLKTPLDRETIAELVEMVPDPPADLVRKDKNFKELGLDPDDYVTADAVVDLLVSHPKLMQRPILVRGRRAVIGRPSDNVVELLD
jgi:arsenate reductase